MPGLPQHKTRRPHPSRYPRYKELFGLSHFSALQDTCNCNSRPQQPRKGRTFSKRTGKTKRKEIRARFQILSPSLLKNAAIGEAATATASWRRHRQTHTISYYWPSNRGKIILFKSSSWSSSCPCQHFPELPPMYSSSDCRNPSLLRSSDLANTAVKLVCRGPVTFIRGQGCRARDRGSGVVYSFTVVVYTWMRLLTAVQTSIISEFSGRER